MWDFVMLAPRVALLTPWVGAGGTSLSLGELSHQLAGLSTALSNPTLLPDNWTSLCQDPDGDKM